MKKRILIWGAGSQGKNILHFFDMNKVIIIGYVDSDPCKVGKDNDGYDIMSVDQITFLKYDFIFISSIEYQDEIYAKALALGVEREKLIFSLMTNEQMGWTFDLLTEKGVSYVNFLKLNVLRSKINALRTRVDVVEHKVNIIEKMVGNEKKRNINRFLKDHYERQAAEFIAFNFIENENAPGRTAIFENRQNYRDYIAEIIKNEQGLFLEFGVYKGKSINYMAERIGNNTIYGFDSFEGLPEYWHPGYEKGRFGDINGVMPQCHRNVKLIKGWFNETLPIFLEQHINERCVYVHIDCDLYSSAIYVLEQLKDRIGAGTIICFDEFAGVIGWQKDEYKAFQEFIKETGYKYKYLACSYACDVEVTEAVAIEIM